MLDQTLKDSVRNRLYEETHTAFNYFLEWVPHDLPVMFYSNLGPQQSNVTTYNELVASGQAGALEMSMWPVTVIYNFKSS